VPKILYVTFYVTQIQEHLFWKPIIMTRWITHHLCRESHNSFRMTIDIMRDYPNKESFLLFFHSSAEATVSARILFRFTLSNILSDRTWQKSIQKKRSVSFSSIRFIRYLPYQCDKIWYTQQIGSCKFLSTSYIFSRAKAVNFYRATLNVRTCFKYKSVSWCNV